MPRPAVQLLAAHVLADRGALALIGRTAAGASVAVEVSDARPYLWARAPPAAARDADAARAFAAELNAALAAAAAGGRKPPAVATATIASYRRFFGYDPEAHPFARVDLESPRSAAAARDALAAHELAEADADFAAQACADLGIAPGAWFELSDDAQPCADMHAATDVQLAATKSAIKPRPDLDGLAPLRVMSLDIETLTKDLGHGAVKFYDGADPEGRLVCVAAVDAVVGGAAGAGPAPARVVFALDPDVSEKRAPADEDADEAAGGVLVRWFADEAALLRALARHVRDRDPDFLTGWNTDGARPARGFDLEWLRACAERVGVGAVLWNALSRFDRERDRARLRDAGGKVRLSAPGRVPYDLLQWFKKNRQLEQYTLEFVAQTFGCGGKDDVEYAQIGELFRSREGRLRLARYCEQDAALVLRLVAAKELDPLGKDLALCAITGTFPADLLARGTQHTLRCKMMRVARARGFVLPYVPRARGASAKDDEPAEAGDDAGGGGDGVGYRGGMVLTARAGRYTDPVAVFDFASLYPSCMIQHNTCASTRLTRARAAELGVATTTPPAPSLEGAWRRADGSPARIEDDWRTGVVRVDGAEFAYESDVCAAIAAARGDARAELRDGGHALEWASGETWTREPGEVLCFVARDVFTGLVPQLEADLKLDRKAAKRKMAAAEAAGDEALEAFCNNIQNSIKVLMNSLYGGFGTARGGIFPDGAGIASAITATGRGWICTVKATIEATAWVAPGGAWGLGADRPPGAAPVAVIYGDTDSVFCHLPGLSVQQAAAFGAATSAHFAAHVLPYPQQLEFEKLYLPFVSWKKKMYAGIKYQDNYGPDARGKLHSRGIALVRRDNAKLVRAVMKQCLDTVLSPTASADDALRVVAQHIALVEASARSLHDGAGRPAGHLPIEQFVISGGISKDLDEYDGPPNAAAMIAERLTELNPLQPVGAGSRVTFVVTAADAGARRAEQAALVSDVMRDRTPLDVAYYVGMVRSKCDPLLSALFAADERRAATATSAFGARVVVAPRRQCDRDKLQGQLLAARRLDAAVRDARRDCARRNGKREARELDAFAVLRAGTATAFRGDKRAKSARAAPRP